MDKLTYYDTLSNLFPGLVFIWALPTLGPFSESKISFFLTNNTIVDSVLVIVLGYVIGHILQFISKYSIEPLLKLIYWKGYFFSDIFLVKAFNQCSNVELARYISFAETKLGFPKEDLSVLLDTEVIENKTKRKKAMDLSKAIYRAIDAKTQDASLAIKAHIHNTFYSFFRNLSSLFLILGVANTIGIVLKFILPTTANVLLIIINFALALIFLIRAKERGELYVRGLFWSYAY